MQEEGSATHWKPYGALAWYVVLGVAWFGAGDAVLAQWVTDAQWAQLLQQSHKYLFVLLTGGFVTWLLHRVQSSERRSTQVMRELTQVLRHVPAGIARVSTADGRIVWANARLAAMLGHSTQALHQLRFRDLLQPKDQALFQLQRQQLIDGEIDHYQSERTYVRPSDGQLCSVICTVTCIPSEDSSPMLVCVVQDISEMEQARQHLERQQQQLRLALEGSRSGMWDWHIASRTRTFSPSVAGLLHYRGRDLDADFDLRERLHPEDAPAFLEAAQRAMQDSLLLEMTVRIRCFDEEYRWFEVRGMRHLDTQGQAERISGTITDKTAQRQREARLRLAATVVENTREGIVVADANSTILSVNRAFTELLGFTEEEMLGQTPRMFKSGRHDKAFYDAMWNSVGRTDHWRGEIWNKRKNGEIFPERMSLSAVRDSSGQVSHYVCMFTDISQEKRREQQLEFLAHRDALTGLYNRSQVLEVLDQVVHEAQGSGEMLAVILLNLDRFKDINDSYGHVVGDEVIKHIARQVQDALRPGDVIGRMAGDEVVVVARHLLQPTEASDIAERLIQAAATPWKSPDGFSIVVSVSAGISLFPGNAENAPLLLQGAHSAVYSAKEARGTHNAWCFFNESMTFAARERMALESRLRHAITAGHLRLFYQPQVDTRTGRLVGAEALVRWFDPVEGMISPGRFIPVAENTGLIGPLGTWVIQEACRQGQAWRLKGLPEISLAVNVSLHQFLLTDLVACVQEALDSSGYPASLLEAEITESALANRPEEALAVVRRLKDVGLRLAIDDFGTGYSSLAHLKRFPIDVLKIDQGFIRDIPHSVDDMAITNAVIAMGHSMGMEVLAEGVETDAQREYLLERGCNFCQGYLFSRPLPAEAFEKLLRSSLVLPQEA